MGGGISNAKTKFGPQSGNPYYMCMYTRINGSDVIEDGLILSTLPSPPPHSISSPSQLPKASDTAALSGAGFMRLVKSVGESISKIAGKKSDSDTVS